MKQTAPLPVLATLAILAACGGNDVPGDAGDAAWRVDSVPILDLGADESDSLRSFTQIVGATKQPDGELIVADRMSFSIRTYSPEGEFLRAFGKEGEGPGEIVFLATMLRCGDSLYVEDIGRQGYLVFSTGGEFIRDVSVAAPEAGQSEYDSACNARGTFLHNGWSRSEEEGMGRRRGPVPYWTTGPTGELLHRIGSFPGSERLVYEGGSSPHPLGKEPSLAIGSDRIYIGTADSLEVMVFSLDGTQLPSISKPSVRLATTPADIERYKFLDTLGMSEQEKQLQMRAWERFQFPPTVPAYTELLVDRNDNLWVRLFHRAPSATVRWLVFSPTGEEIGSLDLPMELIVHEIGADYVLGSAIDLVEGTPRLRMYRLHR